MEETLLTVLLFVLLLLSIMVGCAPGPKPVSSEGATGHHGGRKCNIGAGEAQK